MKKTDVVNPLWLRVWHGLQALLFFGLLSTGLSMHYSDSVWTIIPFRGAVFVHNACGIATAVLWVFFVAQNVWSGNGHHYKPKDVHVIDRLYRQVRYYAIGMFRGENPPFPPGFHKKFNPVQQAVYALVMYVLMPIAIVSGLLLLFPILAPEHALGRGGLWPMAMLHLAVGYALTIFTVLHIYLATTGRTVFSLYAEMATGVRTSEPPPVSEET